MIERVTKKNRSQGVKAAQARREAEEADWIARKAEIERNARKEMDELTRARQDEKHGLQRAEQLKQAMTRQPEDTPSGFADRVLSNNAGLTVVNGIQFLANGKVATVRSRIMAANAILKAAGYRQIDDSPDWAV